ncbi:hypothetical protein E5C33_07570 [Stenotrophomonas maltophilia]|uniref:hypothetical protein n=1 Tax=Stenotrophomonas maltophilia TaxID=40324 RepID=UPI001076A627|nr:hypothetical protein [Stenotrophomonas maltophilia]TFZ46122.1 hypothetical protein E5C33_07570 [Stenotrophomonas maltophilia]
MADLGIPVTQRIVQAVVARLRLIAGAGYHTNIGKHVHDEPTWYIPEGEPCVVVFDASKVKSGDRGVRSEREYVGLIEATIPCSMENAARTRRLADADIEQVLDGWIWDTGALPLQVEESVFLDKPDGLQVIALQVTFSTRYR